MNTLNSNPSTSFALTINFFLAKEIRERLESIVKPMQELFPDHDYLPEKGYHCTVKNLGILPPHLNPRAFIHYRPLLRHVVTSHQPFEIEVTGIDFFPNVLIARVYSPNGELFHIHRELFNLLPGSPRYEGRNYTPHVSLAFFRAPSTRLIGWVREHGYANLFLGRMTVKKMELLNWDIGPLTQSDLIENYYLGSDLHAD